MSLMHRYVIQCVKTVRLSRDGASPVTPPLRFWGTHPGTLIGRGRPGLDSRESEHYILNRNELIVGV
jgi:hypothetical protein